jgi:aspartate kinase
MTQSILPLRVLKFGGSSIGSASGIRRAAGAVSDARTDCRPVLVVSAMASVTDTLGSILNVTGEERARQLSALYHLHLETASELLDPPALDRYRTILTRELGTLIPALRRLESGIGACFDRDQVLAAGERFSAPLIAAFLTTLDIPAEPVDAGSLIRLSGDDSTVDVIRTNVYLRAWASTLPATLVPVVTGFIGGTPCGQTLTLGRGGSDFSAALIASAIGADRMERWTDVDGLFSSDPNADPTAEQYEILLMEDAALLNSAERLGMHRDTITPLLATRTPLRVRSLAGRNTGTLVIPAGERMRSHEI